MKHDKPKSMLHISKRVQIPNNEIEIAAIRAQGAGGQNVNKVSSAVHLRFSIRTSSLPDNYKENLMTLKDRRISGDGIIVIKAQRFRSQEKNRDDALERLQLLIRKAVTFRKKRVATKPSKASQRRRVEEKSKRGKTKRLRAKFTDYSD